MFGSPPPVPLASCRQEPFNSRKASGSTPSSASAGGTAAPRFRKGFTLIEALVAVVLAGIGVAGSIQGIAALTKAQAKSQEKEVMVRLALAKYDELIATGEATNVGGTFDDWGDPRYTWEAVVDTTGEEGLSQLTVIIQSSIDGRDVEQSVSGLVYEAPISTGGTP